MGRRLVAAALLGLALAAPASAGEPTESLRRLFDEANRILLNRDATDESRLSALRRLVSGTFDARSAAALALGPEWQARTPVEREEFSRLYADVVESAYLGGVGARARVHDDGIRVVFESEAIDRGEATVVTSLETRTGAAVPVEYRMRRGDGGWAVVDVIVEGLSLAANYRAQFLRVLQNGTYADLLTRLREKASAATVSAIAMAKTAAVAVVSRPVEPTPREPAPPTVSAITPVTEAPASIPKSFWVQVGAFRDTEAASRLVERLGSYSVIVATGGGAAEPLARVLVGPFDDRAAAASTLRELASGGYRPFIAVE
jgi:phospholipid transport system substrate-binding protein